MAQRSLLRQFSPQAVEARKQALQERLIADATTAIVDQVKVEKYMPELAARKVEIDNQYMGLACGDLDFVVSRGHIYFTVAYFGGEYVVKRFIKCSATTFLVVFEDHLGEEKKVPRSSLDGIKPHLTFQLM